MKNSIIDDFVKKYNEYITLKKGFFSNLNIDFELVTKTEISINYNNNFENLILNYIFPEFSSLDSFVIFEQEILKNEENKNWLSFAEYKNYSLYYTLDIGTGEIFLVNLESNETDYFCSKDFDSFIKSMEIVLEVKGHYFSDKKELIESYLLDFLDKCIKTAGGEKYRDYFKLILGVL